MAKTKRILPNQKQTVKIICSNPECDFKGIPQSEEMFYRTNKFGMSRYPVCKNCIKKRVNIDDMNTVYSILKDMDKPFILSEWKKVLDEYGEDDSIFGNYIKAIARKYKDKTYSDSQFDLVDEESGELIESDPNKIIYSKEWNGHFTQSDINYLNDYLEGMKSDYKIVTKNHMDYAKKVAKASLAMDKEFEKVLRGEPDTVYKNLRDTFDKLSSSAKFSESQRSANDVGLGSFGVIAGRVEKHTWIPEYEPVDKDTYDLIIAQFSNIEKSL